VEELENKPRVFLSHSKRDDEFIERVWKDLIGCQTNPWKDDVDIRHGHPWLDEVFRDGIPRCDAILVYLTDASIESPVVKKEIDASILEQLRDHNVAFLPYVSREVLRENQRAKSSRSLR